MSFIFLELGHKSLDQLQAGIVNMFMIPGLLHLLLILNIIHDCYGGGNSVTGKVTYQGVLAQSSRQRYLEPNF